MEPTQEEKTAAGLAIVKTLNTLALIYKWKDEQPFSDLIDEAYEAFTPEVRKTLVALLWPEEAKHHV